MPIYHITPNDVLFFRDARPMDASGGYGARWPEPSLWFDAVHAALHRAYPEQQDWEHAHRLGRSRVRDMSRERTQRFGSLTTLGPFPVKDGSWMFRTPADLAVEGEDVPTHTPMQPEPGARTNLPPPLRMVVGSRVKPSKERPKAWRSKSAFEAYLRGDTPDSGVHSDDELYAGEWTTGIGIAAETQTQDKERIYSAEYLRLRDGVCMGTGAWLPLKEKGGAEGMGQLLADCRIVVMGGQQRACRVAAAPAENLSDCLPVGASIRGNRVKWVLLSPAVFPCTSGQVEGGVEHAGGWLPNWVDARDGRVRLPSSGESARRPREAREAWRARLKLLPPIPAKLVAAAVPKPIAVSGWSERVHLRQDGSESEHGPKPTLLAVPPGAVYYFEADDERAAGELAAALNWHGRESGPATAIARRGALLGEKGFGIGVCGEW
jgi:CRISPR type III-B/RAMP module-associated protein Cmr3